MGKATARLILQRCGSVIVTGIRTEIMNAAQNELGLIGLIKAFQVDVSKVQSLPTFLDRIDSEHSDVEGLVNAIGSFNPKTFIDHTANDYETYMSFDHAIFFVTRVLIVTS